MNLWNHLRNKFPKRICRSSRTAVNLKILRFRQNSSGPRARTKFTNVWNTIISFDYDSRRINSNIMNHGCLVRFKREREWIVIVELIYFEKIFIFQSANENTSLAEHNLATVTTHSDVVWRNEDDSVFIRTGAEYNKLCRCWHIPQSISPNYCAFM